MEPTQVRKLIALVDQDLTEGPVESSDLHPLLGPPVFLLDPLLLLLQGARQGIEAVEPLRQVPEGGSDLGVLIGYPLNQGVLARGLPLGRLGLQTRLLGVRLAALHLQGLQGRALFLQALELAGRLLAAGPVQVLPYRETGEFLLERPQLRKLGLAARLQGPGGGLGEVRGPALRRRLAQLLGGLVQALLELQHPGACLGGAAGGPLEELVQLGETRLQEGRLGLVLRQALDDRVRGEVAGQVLLGCRIAGT